ncbi:unnamed protein product [Heligmosomoides polygyrus]|uniref:LsmAD domain-containing protein n=1 Tax=Heligmosomoides polygyrus TaxID=6339 RepID=A0A183G063_HELPZ|nr:unnamed protein product [Heligmosomoides polygyrus]
MCRSYERSAIDLNGPSFVYVCRQADIAVSRTSTAKERAEQAMFVAKQARDDADMAKMEAERFDPNFKPQGHERRRHYGENPGGESFGTDVSDPHSSYSRHLSQTHSKQPSFEQNLSVDVPDASYLTPMAPPPPLQLTGITPSGQASPHVGNHVGSPQSAYLVNHVNFNLQSGPHVHLQQEDVTPENYSSPLQFEKAHQDAATATQLQDVVEVAEPPEAPSQKTTTSSALNPTMANNPQSSSRFSLSDDHFDQYVMAGTSGQPRLRRNRPSLMRQNDVNDVSMLNRRSTLASSRDRRAAPAEPTQDSSENLGSLPNLAELESSGVLPVVAAQGNMAPPPPPLSGRCSPLLTMSFPLTFVRCFAHVTVFFLSPPRRGAPAPTALPREFVEILSAAFASAASPSIFLLESSVSCKYGLMMRFR